MSNSLSTHTTSPTASTTSPTATPWSTRAGQQFLATGKWFMENPMPAPEAASDERINKLIDAKQKDVIALLNDVKESLRTMQADVTTMKTDITTMKTDITTLKADMTEVKASIGTLNNRQDVQDYNAERRRRNQIDQTNPSKIIPLKSFITGELLPIGSSVNMLPATHERASKLNRDRIHRLAEHFHVDIEGLEDLEAKHAVLRYMGCVAPAAM